MRMRMRDWSRASAAAGLVAALVLLLAGSALAQDTDLDGAPDGLDNCVVVPNTSGPGAQADRDGDGIGDACECGDASGDGRVNSIDARLIQRCAIGLFPCPELCDVSADGRCNTIDARLVQRMSVGILDKSDLACRQRPPSDCSAIEGLLRPGCDGYGDVVEALLGRAAHGGSADTRQRVFELGLEGWLREQLEPASIPDTVFDARVEPYRSGPFAMWGMPILELESRFCIEGAPRCTNRVSSPVHLNLLLAEAKLLRALYSRRQLEAVLMDFWLNHFNVDGSQDLARWAMQSYEQDSIRPYVLGPFEDLLLHITQGAAMLDYLDLRLNRRNNTNENFPRELMELHTVGKDGTYDEADVQQVTLVLTGWSLDGDREFVYVPGRHDPVDKLVTLEDTEPWVFDGALGCAGRPPEAFQNEGHVLLCLLARHPRTAERLSRKLLVRFSGDDPPQDLVDAVATVWLSSGGHLGQVMEAILLNNSTLALAAARAKIRRPLLYSAALARGIGPDSEGVSEIVFQAPRGDRVASSFRGTIGGLFAMGEPLYYAAPPTGYPEASSAWASSGGVLARLNLATRVVAGIESPAAYFGIPSGANGLEIVFRVWQAASPGGFSEATLLRIARHVDEELPAGSTVDERTAQAARMILSAPDALVH